ncbi:MAG: twin-arginine translocase TatA/TatE family subunit [Candidatus Theseobacter exili]|nr:twin-arginine translocase TatA/TatE family subunit [Candidatus Theseobacter exili]
MPGTWEWLIILAVILLLFGARKLPEIARNLGKGIREFKKASKDISSDLDCSEDKTEQGKKPEDNLSGNDKE